jgi:hypothetical protein
MVLDPRFGDEETVSAFNLLWGLSEDPNPEADDVIWCGQCCVWGNRVSSLP